MPRSAAKDSCLIPFHTQIGAALVAGVSNTLVSPNVSFGTRLLVEADAWAHFRVKALKFRLHPYSAMGIEVAGFVGGIQDTPPATISQVTELIPSAIKGLGSTVPTEWVRVGKSELAGPLPWYKTIPGTADATEEAPGQLVVVGSGATDLYLLEIRGVFEFKTAIATGNTPAAIVQRRGERELRALQCERDRLLNIISAGKTSPVLGGVLRQL